MPGIFKFWPSIKQFMMLGAVGLIAALLSISSVQSAVEYPILAMFDETNGASLGQGHVGWHQGLLFVPSGRDAGAPGGGFSFYDISDPRNPQLVSTKFDSELDQLREIHTFGVSEDIFAMQSTEGVMFWDMSDVQSPQLVHHMDLPGVQEADYGGAWWLHWQAPYLYLATLDGGLYIVNTADIQNPVLVNRLSPGDLGMAPRAAFAVGNLLVLAQDRRVATFDISNPAEPVRLGKLETDSAYAWMLNGDLMLGAGLDGQLIVVDLSDPENLVLASNYNILGARGGYIKVQDDVAHVGATEQYVKIDMSDPTNPSVIGVGSSGISGRDEDFATVLGNLVFVGNDHENGSALIQHSDADVTPPTVASVSPTPDATNVAVSSRIGLSLSDMIDVASLTADNLIVRPVGDEPLAGTLSHQFGIVNFSPAQPLEPNTSYEIVLPAGGLSDVAGNINPAEFVSRFSTGESVDLVGGPTDPPEILTVRTAGAQPFSADEPITFEVSAEGAEPLEYFWDFGDRTPPADWSVENEQVSHAYAETGNYSVLVRVRDGNGHTAAELLSVSVTPPVPEHLPQSSGPLALDGAARQLWVANPDNGTVTLIGTDKLAVEQEIRVCTRPNSVAVDNQSRAWIACRSSDQIVILDGNGGRAGAIKLNYGAQPVSVVFDAQGQTGYVAEYGTGLIHQIDAETVQIVATHPIGSTPHTLALTGDGQKLLVSRFISIGDAGAVWQIEIDQFGSQAAEIRLPIDRITEDDDKQGRGLPNYVAGVAIHPTEPQAWVASKKDNIERGAFRDGQPLTFESSVRGLLSSINLETGDETVPNRVDINNHAQPSAAVYSPFGNHVFVAMQGNNRVIVFDAQTGDEVARADTGLAPQGLVLDPTTGRLFSKDFLSRTVTVFDSLEILSSGSGALKQVAQIHTVANEKLNPTILLGKQLFYDARDPRLAGDGYMSCASCHIDGGHDGRTWDMTHMGEGLRNTTDLRGRNIGNDLLHWTGNFDEIQDFEMQIRELAGGTGLIDDELLFADGLNRPFPLGDPKAGLSPELDALAAYVLSLDSIGRSPFRNADGSLTAEGQAGRLVFEQAGCASCHGGDNFDESVEGERFDVGTQSAGSGDRLGSRLDGFDPPTLRGLWQSAPYLHDGSALTLEDVLENVTHVGELSAADKQSLLAYLLQLDIRAGVDGELTKTGKSRLFLPTTSEP